MQVLVDLKVSEQTVNERWTLAAVNAFIEDAVGRTGLNQIGERAVEQLPGQLSFMQMIAESHISGHLMYDYRLGWIDVFSCKPLAAIEIGRAIQRHLIGPGDGLRVRVLGRGVLPEGGTDGVHDQGARAQVCPD